jgi:pimeloyl-ACP methyl ester carboxylesterase
VVFIHGYNQNAEHWDVTETGKEIKVAERCSGRFLTISIGLDITDYCQPIDLVCMDIDRYLSLYSNITLVSHSFGAFYAIGLSLAFPTKYNRLLLLNPTLKTNAYREFVIKHRPELDFDELPDGLALQAKTIVRIHHEYPIDEEKISILDGLTNKNVKSRLVIHPGKGHMLHYQIPATIIDAVIELVNIK